MKDIDLKSHTHLMSQKLSFVIYAGASWCMPCRRLTPIIETLEKEYQLKTSIYHLNCDTEGELAGNLRIMAIPCLLFVKNGLEVDRGVGVLSESEIRSKIEKILQ